MANQLVRVSKPDLNEHKINVINDKIRELSGRIDGAYASVRQLGYEVLTSTSGNMTSDDNTVLEEDNDRNLRLGEIIELILIKFQQIDSRYNLTLSRLAQLEADVAAVASVPIRTVLFGTFDLHTVFSNEFEGVDTHHSLDLEWKQYIFGILQNDWDRQYNNPTRDTLEILQNFFEKNYIHTRMAAGRMYGTMTVLRQKWTGAIPVATQLAGKGGLPPTNVDFYDESHTYQGVQVNMKPDTQVDDGKYNDGELSARGQAATVLGDILTLGLAVAAIGASFYFAGPIGAGGANAITRDIVTSALTGLGNAILEYANTWAKDYLIRDGILAQHRKIKSSPKLEFRRNDEKQYYDKSGVMLSKVRTTSYSERRDGFHLGRPSAKANESPLVGGSTRTGYNEISHSRKVHTMSQEYEFGFVGSTFVRHHSLANIFTVKIKHQDWVNDPRYTISFDNDINRAPTDSTAWKSGSYGSFDRAEGDAFALNGLLIAAYDYTLNKWQYYDSSGNWTTIA
jgi:hypothetical protein